MQGNVFYLRVLHIRPYMPKQLCIIHMYAYIHIYIRICIHIQLHIHIYIHILYMYACTYIYTHVCVYECVCMYYAWHYNTLYMFGYSRHLQLHCCTLLFFVELKKVAGWWLFFSAHLPGNWDTNHHCWHGCCWRISLTGSYLGKITSVQAIATECIRDTMYIISVYIYN